MAEGLRLGVAGLGMGTGRWGEATLEVCLAMPESTARHEEIHMKHQVPVTAALARTDGR